MKTGLARNQTHAQPLSPAHPAGVPCVAPGHVPQPGAEASRFAHVVGDGDPSEVPKSEEHDDRDDRGAGRAAEPPNNDRDAHEETCVHEDVDHHEASPQPESVPQHRSRQVIDEERIVECLAENHRIVGWVDVAISERRHETRMERCVRPNVLRRHQCPAAPGAEDGKEVERDQDQEQPRCEDHEPTRNLVPARLRPEPCCKARAGEDPQRRHNGRQIQRSEPRRNDVQQPAAGGQPHDGADHQSLRPLEGNAKKSKECEPPSDTAGKEEERYHVLVRRSPTRRDRKKDEKIVCIPITAVVSPTMAIP